MGNNKSKRSRSSGKGSSSGSFKPGDIFGGSGGGLVPVFAIVCGVLIGMGGAYVVKRVIFGGKQKKSEVAMIEESDRVPGRSKLKREARVRPVETADVSEPIQYVEQPPMAAPEPTPPAPIPTPEPRSLPRADPLPPEPRHTVSASKKVAHVAAPSKAPIRVTPAPKPAPTLAMLEPAPSPQEPVEEKLVPPKFMTLRNLTYSRQLFSRCAEDCLLLFRAADGGAVKAKLKKSSFMRVLSNNLAYADIDGYESTIDGERVIVVKSIRGMPVATPPPPAPKHEVAKPVEKVAETPKVEKKKDKTAAEPSNRRKNGEDTVEEGGDSLRNRLEGSKSKKKEDSNEESGDGEEEEGSTFQNRLKKSLD